MTHVGSTKNSVNIYIYIRIRTCCILTFYTIQHFVTHVLCISVSLIEQSCVILA